MSIPRELAQARHIELLETVLELVPDGRGYSSVKMGAMSRDGLIAFILDERERQDRDFRRAAVRFMNENDEVMRRLAS